MIAGLARKIFGTANDRVIKSVRHLIEDINALEDRISVLDDQALQAQTPKLKAELAAGRDLDDILPEAFATVREAAKRTLGQRHFDVQLMGGIVLHQGKIAEMKTGEGKTLVATLPVYLNALMGKGVHVITVNDYLARRDSAWMGQVYTFLGLTVGSIVHGLTDPERKAAYAADVTYGTNNEFGFDYLRDNMKFSADEMVQRPFNFAIVDEVDSILVDEARTPLIISGPAQDSSELYQAVDQLMPLLNAETDYEKDEKHRTVALTEAGTEHIESILRERGLLETGGLYDAQNVSLVHHVNQALRAHALFTRDVDYIVKDDKVIIIDEFTGRMMQGRRYSEGLHQALEAKEHVTIEKENQTLASITFQNYFRMYPKLAGMTGTAMTEADEFAEIYKLQVVEMPTNRILARQDEHDEVYRTAREKYDAIVKVIEEARERQQPILVGTTSIEKSELLAALLKKHKIPHQVLNARYHEQEAAIIAQAGRPGAVTIATNMAGRGTDIQLGGNLDMRIAQELEDVTNEAERQKRIQDIRDQIEVARGEAHVAGGLYVVGTERHESRRIDNQLRGRSGRQGDPGASRFFLSLDDDLMRIFGSQRMDAILQRLGLKEGEAIVHPWINKALERAQHKVEQHHFEIRKNLLRYDDVMNDQRKVVYEQRREIIESNEAQELVRDMRHDVIQDVIGRHIPAHAYAEQWDLEGLEKEIMDVFNLELPLRQWATEDGINDEEVSNRLLEASNKLMDEKRVAIGEELMTQVERNILLQLLDTSWKEHLLALDHLRQGINLRAYAQRDPLNEYKREAFELFQAMLVNLREQVTRILSHIELRMLQPEQFVPRPVTEMHESRRDPALALDRAEHPGALPFSNVQTLEHDQEWGKVPRNAACPCGSGLKYKHCHGKSE